MPYALPFLSLSALSLSNGSKDALCLPREMNHLFNCGPMRRARTWTHVVFICIPFVISIVCFESVAVAQTKATFTPRISVSETYDDNIDLDPEDEESDWITVLSPGFLLELDSQKTQLDLDYEFGLSYYLQDSSRDTIRHQGRLSWDQQLAQYLSLNVTNTFTRSEDPVREEDGRVTDISSEREVEYRNTGEANLTWQFGPQDTLSLGYRNHLLDSRSDDTEDSRANEGFLNLDTWFVQQFGIGLTSSFGRWQFQQPSGFTDFPTEDFRRYQAGLTVNYRWRPSRLIYGRYDVVYQDFGGTTPGAYDDDYVVHQPTLGLNLDFGPNSGFAVEFGYFRRDIKNADTEEGFVLDASFNTKGERASFNIQTISGYELDYGSSDNRGFSKYSDSSVNVDYQLTEDSRFFATARYRWQNYTDIDQTDHTYGGRAGFAFTFRQWFTLSFEGVHLRRDSNDSAEEFTDNRVMLSIIAAHPIPLFGE